MELTVTGIRKTFDSADGEPAFHLELPKLTFQLGEITYILGHNGSGKSLFLKLLSGEISPTNSLVKIEFENKKYSPNEMEVAIVRQKAEENLCVDLSVEENLLLRLPTKTLKEKLFPKSSLKQQVIASINEQNELIRKLKQVCSNLSGGQKQSLAYFTAAAQKCRILCLDEFLSSTDYNTSLMLREKTKQYSKENHACVLIVSHDLDVALEDADNILIFNNGSLLRQLNKDSSQWNKSELVQMIHLL